MMNDVGDDDPMSFSILTAATCWPKQQCDGRFFQLRSKNEALFIQPPALRTKNSFDFFIYDDDYEALVKFFHKLQPLLREASVLNYSHIRKIAAVLQLYLMDGTLKNVYFETHPYELCHVSSMPERIGWIESHVFSGGQETAQDILKRCNLIYFFNRFHCISEEDEIIVSRLSRSRRNYDNVLTFNRKWQLTLSFGYISPTFPSKRSLPRHHYKIYEGAIREDYLNDPEKPCGHLNMGLE